VESFEIVEAVKIDVDVDEEQEMIQE